MQLLLKYIDLRYPTKLFFAGLDSLRNYVLRSVVYYWRDDWVLNLTCWKTDLALKIILKAEISLKFIPDETIECGF